MYTDRKAFHTSKHSVF